MSDNVKSRELSGKWVGAAIGGGVLAVIAGSIYAGSQHEREAPRPISSLQSPYAGATAKAEPPAVAAPAVEAVKIDPPAAPKPIRSIGGVTPVFR